MAYRLALFFRKPNVDAMLREWTAKQFIEWEAFIELEPWSFDPELRADYRTAAICQMIYNTQVTKKADLKKLEEFLLHFEKPKEKKQKSPAEIFEILKVMSVVQNHMVAQGAGEENALERARAAMIPVADRITFKDL